jgi:hypothetical protein
LRAIFLSETTLIDTNAEQFLCQQDFELARVVKLNTGCEAATHQQSSATQRLGTFMRPAI